MPRKLKPYKVDDVRSPNGYTTADVMFDRDAKKFFVEVVPGDGDSRVYSDLLEDVKTKASAALARAQKYEWTPLILVSVSEPWYHNANSVGEHAGLKLEFRRFERSPNPAHPDKFVEREHELDACPADGPKKRDREHHRDINPYSGRDSIGPAVDKDDDALLEYDQAVWDGLCAVARIVQGAHAQLAEILGHRQVARLLAGATKTASRLLVSGKGGAHG